MAKRYCKAIDDLISEMGERHSKRMSDILNMKMSIMHVMPGEEMNARMPILESIPKDMRDRVYSIEQTADGTVTVYLNSGK